MTQATAPGSTPQPRMTNAEFRTATLADLVGIAAIEIEAFGEHAYPYHVLRTLFDLHGMDWLVVEEDGDVVGYVQVAVTLGQRAWLVGFALTAGSRGRGYGRVLLGMALDRCRDGSARRVFITVRPTNDTANRLYEDAGFVLAGHYDDYYGENEPRNLLVCDLTR
ncbi:GNAT family N-acetyltransferase [Nocardia australiensis]|uniref:GNAT family N-acetyltransferase n=1 Tax=Nocardia australiensis TaxID=2887191 RepID=UPI001D13FE27|nr:GNAT family N-acetyltransferase [Nocardia australiensis]